MPHARVYKSTNQSIPDNVPTAVSFDLEEYDIGPMHDVVTNNSRLTIPAAAGGLYDIIGSISWQNAAAGLRKAVIYVNGAPRARDEVVPSATNAITNQVCAQLELSAGDYIQLFAHQDSGGALQILGPTADLCSLSAVKIPTS